MALTPSSSPPPLRPRWWSNDDDTDHKSKSYHIVRIIVFVLSLISILLICWAIHRRLLAARRRRLGILPGVTVIVDPGHPAYTGYGPVPTGAVPMNVMPPAYSEPAPPYGAAGGIMVPSGATVYMGVPQASGAAAGVPSRGGGGGERVSVQPVPQEPAPSYYAPNNKVT